jgi:HAE1 family hydrophobic/amphiphilic exporter-1
MLYVGVILLGVIAWTRLPQELYPPITYPQLTIVTHYKDAAPEEMEILVTPSLKKNLPW